MGRPVIATDHGAARETVLPGKTGWLVPPGDAKKLAEALAWALELSPIDRDRLAAEARAHIVRNFSSQAMCAATLDVYREVLAGNGPP